MTKTTRHHSTRVKCSDCIITTDNFGKKYTVKKRKAGLAYKSNAQIPKMTVT